MKQETACLIIHGLAGNVAEIEPLYKYLCSRGVHAYTVLLQGHGKTNRELSRSTHKQWINSAEAVLLRLKNEYSNIILIGFSMGGLIATNLINKYGADGAIFINTPVYYWDVKRILSNLSSDFKNYFSQYFMKSTDKPLRTLIEFVLLLNKTKGLFGELNTNTLVLQAKDDDTVNYKSAKFILNRARGVKKVKYYDEGGHAILHSSNSGKVCQDILEFIKDTR